MILYTDMDGVLSNFEERATQVIGAPLGQVAGHGEGNKTEAKDAQYQLIRQTPQFWEELPLMPGAMTYWRYIMKFDPHFLTAYASWDEKACKKGKLFWIRKYFGSIPLSRIHIVRRDEKQDYATSQSEKNVLVDDYVKNIRQFIVAGGYGIVHTDVQTTIRQLHTIGF